jgi:hypothetical protein
MCGDRSQLATARSREGLSAGIHDGGEPIGNSPDETVTSFGQFGQWTIGWARAKNAIDGSNAICWRADDKDSDPWWQIDLGDV